VTDEREGQAVTADLFRNLLGRFATGVTVVATRDDAGNPVGMTASSVSSVSLDPPLVSVCVDHRAEIHRWLTEADSFGISILASGQEEVSRIFATTGAERFGATAWRASPAGAPWLEGSLATIECLKHQSIEAGDHTLFVGRVTAGTAAEGEPLLYYLGNYRQLGHQGS